jgi:hypothetical protein
VTATDPVAKTPIAAQQNASNQVMAGLNAVNTAMFTFANTCYYHAAYFNASHSAIPPTTTDLSSSANLFVSYYMPRYFAASGIVPELCHPYRDRTFADEFFAPAALADDGDFTFYNRYSLLGQTVDNVNGVCCTSTGQIEIM